MITQKQLRRFVELTKSACYDYAQVSDCGLGKLKQEYRNLGRRILKDIAERMGLTKGQYDIRWNPGGIACSGDSTLHTDKVYVALHDNCGSGWFYWRTVKGRRDFTGGPNQIVRWDDFCEPEGMVNLIRVLKVAQQGSFTDPSTGDIILNINQAIRMAAGVA